MTTALAAILVFALEVLLNHCTEPPIPLPPLVLPKSALLRSGIPVTFIVSIKTLLSMVALPLALITTPSLISVVAVLFVSIILTLADTLLPAALSDLDVAAT